MKKCFAFLVSLLLVLSLSGVAIAGSENPGQGNQNGNGNGGNGNHYGWGNGNGNGGGNNGGDSTKIDIKNNDFLSHNKIGDVAIGGTIDKSINVDKSLNIDKSINVDAKVTIKDNVVKTNIDASKNYIKGDLVKGDKVAGDKNLIKGDYYADGSLKNEGVIDQSVTVPRDFPQPATPVYPGFTNDPGDTTFANVQSVQTILMFGCEYNKTHLANMKSDGAVKTLQFSNIYGNENAPADTDTIIYVLDPKQIAVLKLKKIGTVVVKSRTGNTTTEQVLADAGMQALTIKGAKYIYISGEGFQKSTSALGFGLSLGYTYASVGGDREDHGQVGAAGIGVAYGNTGRQADPYIQGIVLTDEKTFNELMAPKPEPK